ncbi:SRPBCC family protein [Microbacterium karelineae]|uniref:SRPBCC family protein n=1 Tax=Microbacterium karelineae TaxID=2654283 RepID=UPI0018D434E7|nr:SRPBCC family protein [Microbacterium karelineae]
MIRERPPLYVEASIRAPIERVWELTQDPELHARWDARFSAIVPTGERADGAQEFRYELVLPLHTIRGTGISLGEKESASGARTSALLFDTSDRLSPVGAGRGYWRYVPHAGGVRFITGYDYAPGFGPAGRLLDRLVVRRAMWWLTAWSFDRLRIWAEDGIPPERARWRARAGRCLSRPPRRTRDVMADAPESLERIAAYE